MKKLNIKDLENVTGGVNPIDNSMYKSFDKDDESNQGDSPDTGIAPIKAPGFMAPLGNKKIRGPFRP